MFCAAFLSKKTNLLDFNIKIGIQPSLSQFDQSLVISCLKNHVRSVDIGCWERPADSRKVWKVFVFFFTLFLFIKHYHYFWCGECNFFVCLFVWICLAFSVFVLFYLFIYFFVVGGVVLFVLFFLFSFCCCFYVLFCFCF